MLALPTWHRLMRQRRCQAGKHASAACSNTHSLTLAKLVMGAAVAGSHDSSPSRHGSREEGLEREVVGPVP